MITRLFNGAMAIVKHDILQQLLINSTRYYLPWSNDDLSMKIAGKHCSALLNRDIMSGNHLSLLIRIKLLMVYIN